MQQYKIVYSQSCIGMDSALKDLEKKVNELCREGWKPQGGVSITTQDYEFYCASQAMVK